MNKPLLIDKYKVGWEQAGWSYAVPLIYELKPHWLLPISVWKKVWEGRAKAFLTASKSKPDELLSWYKYAIKEYEEYQNAWNKVDQDAEKE